MKLQRDWIKLECQIKTIFPQIFQMVGEWQLKYSNISTWCAFENYPPRIELIFYWHLTDKRRKELAVFSKQCNETIFVIGELRDEERTLTTEIMTNIAQKFNDIEITKREKGGCISYWILPRYENPPVHQKARQICQ